MEYWTDCALKIFFMAYIKDWTIYRGRYHSYVRCIYARIFTRVGHRLPSLYSVTKGTECNSNIICICKYVVLCSEIPTVIDLKQDAFLQVRESILLRS